MRMLTSEPIQQWISRVSSEAASCVDVGCTIDDGDKLAVLLNGLTDAYKTTKKVLLGQASVSEKPLTWLSATAALISDEASEIAVEGATAFWSNGAKPNSNSNAKKSDKKKGDCRWCGKPGHWEAECRQKAAGKPRTEKPNNKNNSQNGGTTASKSKTSVES